MAYLHLGIDQQLFHVVQWFYNLIIKLVTICRLVAIRADHKIYPEKNRCFSELNYLNKSSDFLYQMHKEASTLRNCTELVRIALVRCPQLTKFVGIRLDTRWSDLEHWKTEYSFGSPYILICECYEGTFSNAIVVEWVFATQQMGWAWSTYPVPLPRTFQYILDVRMALCGKVLVHWAHSQ